MISSLSHLCPLTQKKLPVDTDPREALECNYPTYGSPYRDAMKIFDLTENIPCTNCYTVQQLSKYNAQSKCKADLDMQEDGTYLMPVIHRVHLDDVHHKENH